MAQLQLKGLQLDDEYILSFHYIANREVTVGLGSQTLKQLRPAGQPQDEMLVFTARTTGSDHIDLCMKRTNDWLEVGAVSVEHKASGRLLIAVPLHGNQSADGSECSSHAECASRRCLPSSHICKFQRIPSRVCVPQGGAQDGHACCTNSDCKNMHCHQQETEKGDFQSTAYCVGPASPNGLGAVTQICLTHNNCQPSLRCLSNGGPVRRCTDLGASGGCQDRNPSLCGPLKAKGLCSSHYFAIRCKKTCGLCGELEEKQGKLAMDRSSNALDPEIAKATESKIQADVSVAKAVAAMEHTRSEADAWRQRLQRSVHASARAVAEQLAYTEFETIEEKRNHVNTSSQQLREQTEDTATQRIRQHSSIEQDAVSKASAFVQAIQALQPLLAERQNANSVLKQLYNSQTAMAQKTMVSQAELRKVALDKSRMIRLSSFSPVTLASVKVFTSSFCLDGTQVAVQHDTIKADRNQPEARELFANPQEVILAKTFFRLQELGLGGGFDCDIRSSDSTPDLSTCSSQLLYQKNCQVKPTKEFRSGQCSAKQGGSFMILCKNPSCSHKMQARLLAATKSSAGSLLVGHPVQLRDKNQNLKQVSFIKTGQRPQTCINTGGHCNSTSLSCCGFGQCFQTTPTVWQCRKSCQNPALTCYNSSDSVLQPAADVNHSSSAVKHDTISIGDTVELHQSTGDILGPFTIMPATEWKGHFIQMALQNFVSTVHSIWLETAAGIADSIEIDFAVAEDRSHPEWHQAAGLTANLPGARCFQVQSPHSPIIQLASATGEKFHLTSLQLFSSRDCGSGTEVFPRYQSGFVKRSSATGLQSAVLDARPLREVGSSSAIEFERGRQFRSVRLSTAEPVAQLVLRESNPSGSIRIQYATYGVGCTDETDLTAMFVSTCQGKLKCNILVPQTLNKATHSCQNGLLISYTCGPNPILIANQIGESAGHQIELSCAQSWANASFMWDPEDQLAFNDMSILHNVKQSASCFAVYEQQQPELVEDGDSLDQACTSGRTIDETCLWTDGHMPKCYPPAGLEEGSLCCNSEDCEQSSLCLWSSQNRTAKYCTNIDDVCIGVQEVSVAAMQTFTQLPEAVNVLEISLGGLHSVTSLTTTGTVINCVTQYKLQYLDDTTGSCTLLLRLMP